MTTFGDDLSSFQHGINVGALPDPFVICKCTEGTYYTDADYPVWRQQAASSGKIFIPYHFISGEDPDAQAKHVGEKIGNKSLPLMIDFEPEGTYKPTLQQLIALADACSREGLHVALAYLPRWYWEQIGSPDLTPLARRGISLVSSQYPGGSGYPGDNAAGWESYGGMTPLIYQFTNDAPVQGRPVDRNAYRGSTSELAADLTPGAPVATYTMSTGWQNDYQDVAEALQKHIPAGMEIDEGLAAAYAMVRSFVAAERAGNIEAQLAEALPLLRQLATAPVATPAPAPVDVDGLAAALVTPLAAALQPHISGGIDVTELAQKVAGPVAHAAVMEMGAALSAAPAPAADQTAS
jgi:hypothetical protein